MESFFKKVDRIEQSNEPEPEPVPSMSGVSETAACSISYCWQSFSSTTFHILSHVQSVVLDKSPGKRIKQSCWEDMTQYVTCEGVQVGTANILKAGWPPGDGKPSADCSCPWCLGGTQRLPGSLSLRQKNRDTKILNVSCTGLSLKATWPAMLT